MPPPTTTATPGVGGSGGSTGEGGGATSTSTGAMAICGNAIVEGLEQCDPPTPGVCDDNCMNVGGGECTEADSYDPACASNPNGGWCWDGGDGGPLFCGCEPQYETEDCPEGRQRCNPATFTCEPPPDCGVDANEDNDTEAMATALSGTVQGAACRYDVDWFSFAATDTAAEISVTWTDDGNTDLDIVVTDCAGTELGRVETGTPDSETLIVSGLTATETYCAGVLTFASPNDGAGDATYSITTTARTGCFLDSECTGQVCPFIGPEAGVCAATAPSAGCGDDTPGDNDTSGNAEALTSGNAVTEASCDGGANNPVDVDFFSFTVNTGDQIDISVNQTTSLNPGDVDILLFDATGDVWGQAASVANPEVISGTGLPAGTYYLVVYYYDNDPQADSGDSSYTVTVTNTAGTGCGSRDDCGAFPGKGECTGGVCLAFEGNASQEPGQFCDSDDDCNPATTGSTLLNGLCFTADPASGTDNVCVEDCASNADCDNGTVCSVLQNGGICLAPCTSDAGCGGLTCNVADGTCS